MVDPRTDNHSLPTGSPVSSATLRIPTRCPAFIIPPVSVRATMRALVLEYSSPNFSVISLAKSLIDQPCSMPFRRNTCISPRIVSGIFSQYS